MWLSRRLWALVLGASLGAGSWAAATRRRAQGDFGTDDNNSRLQSEWRESLTRRIDQGLGLEGGEGEGDAGWA
jgi:hypothetical protein